MPKRTDIKSILIIGAGPIVIGQACEFDYSGAQACKALREEGYRVILVNSNPATIMTDPSMADATYIEPITWQTVAQIIEKERPDCLFAAWRRHDCFPGIWWKIKHEISRHSPPCKPSDLTFSIGRHAFLAVLVGSVGQHIWHHPKNPNPACPSVIVASDE